jgi:hypothetical protein
LTKNIYAEWQAFLKVKSQIDNDKNIAKIAHDLQSVLKYGDKAPSKETIINFMYYCAKDRKKL